MMMSQHRRLLIRADAGPKIGMGHLMRCLALAQAWSDLGGAVAFLVTAPASGVQERVAQDGFGSNILEGEPGSNDDVSATVTAARSFGAQYVVMDGYSFGPEFQRGVAQAGFATACIDDYGHLPSYHVDLIVNQNLDSTPALYERSQAGTRLLLGSEFVMLRRDFTSHVRIPRVDREPATRVLVTMGGADPANVTCLIAHGLAHSPLDVEAVLVVGAANTQGAMIASLAETSGERLSVLVDVPSLRSLMEWADVIVCGGGTTCWEAAFMGVPMIVAVVAENQIRIAEALARHGAAINLGNSGSLTDERVAESIGSLLRDRGQRAEMTRRAVGIVDGLGARRVAMAIQSLTGAA